MQSIVYGRSELVIYTRSVPERPPDLRVANTSEEEQSSLRMAVRLFDGEVLDVELRYGEVWKSEKAVPDRARVVRQVSVLETSLREGAVTWWLVARQNGE